MTEPIAKIQNLAVRLDMDLFQQVKIRLAEIDPNQGLQDLIPRLLREFVLGNLPDPKRASGEIPIPPVQEVQKIPSFGNLQAGIERIITIVNNIESILGVGDGAEGRTNQRTGRGRKGIKIKATGKPSAELERAREIISGDSGGQANIDKTPAQVSAKKRGGT